MLPSGFAGGWARGAQHGTGDGQEPGGPPRCRRCAFGEGGGWAAPSPSLPGCNVCVPSMRQVHAKLAVLYGKSVFRLKKAVAILQESVRPLLEPVIEVVLLLGAFVGGTGALSPRREAGRGAAGAGSGWRWPAPWRGAAGHGALQRWRVHVLQEGRQRCVPRGWPGGAAGTGRAEG